MNLTPARWGTGEYPNFTKAEFDCRHTGLNEMKHEFMVKLQQLRAMYGRSIFVTSGYRHPTHPIEASKGHSNGEHTKGTCCDIRVTNSKDRYHLLSIAFQLGFTRIGFHKSFLHLGIGDSSGTLPEKVCWDY
jgi:zinc D-Ala-D-Ala carboxypeptidase